MRDQITSSEYCELLDWDSKFFGYRIARANNLRWDKDIVNSIKEWRQNENVDCIYILADVNDFEACQYIPMVGGCCVDVRVNFVRNLAEPIDNSVSQTNIMIRPVSYTDIPVLKYIASYSYHDTRFYFDRHFDRSKCDELYQIWIQRSCEKIIADEVLVAQLNQYPVGYITCSVKNNIGTIGLVGVSHEARGQGVGRQLVLNSLEWFKRHNCTIVHVATQGRNVLAQRVYERAGFLANGFSLWYHSW